MIKSFAVKNYKSIKELLQIDFTDKGQMISVENKNLFKNYNSSKISRLNFLYGKNGSGKSTIINAIQSMKDIVMTTRVSGSEIDFMYSSNEGVKITPFKITNEIGVETFFSMIFMYLDKEYRYTIKYNNEDSYIVDEVLENLDEGITIYSKIKKIFMNISKIEKERLQTYNLNNNSLLTLLHNEIVIKDNETSKHISNAYNFFDEISFDFIRIDSKKSLKKLSENKESLKRISDQVKLFDLSIDSIEVKERMVSFNDYINRYKVIERDGRLPNGLMERLKYLYDKDSLEYDLSFIHKKHKLTFPEESSGTREIVNILFSLNASNKKVWIIDDFENDLHKEASIQLIKYLSQNYLDMQFIFVTHELSVLNIKEVRNKALHYLTERDNKNLSTSLVYLTQYTDLRSDDRNSWERFYRNYRLAQYPEITINESER